MCCLSIGGNVLLSSVHLLLSLSLSLIYTVFPSVFSYSFQVLLPQVPTAHHTSLSLRRVSQFCFFPPHVCLPGQAVSPLGTETSSLTFLAPTTALSTQEALNQCLFSK